MSFDCLLFRTHSHNFLPSPLKFPHKYLRVHPGLVPADEEHISGICYVFVGVVSVYVLPEEFAVGAELVPVGVVAFRDGVGF